MKVPFIDLKHQIKEIEPACLAALRRLLKRGDFILGEDVQNFEKTFASFVQTRFALGVNSGTDALFFALLSAGVGPGDEVIVPDFTYIASAFAVCYTGAKPVFADIDDDTFNIDPEKIPSLITKKTKAVMPVHLYGQSADMDKIIRIAGIHNLAVIEDAAQAHGATYKGRAVGSIGNSGAFSFYPTKNLGGLGDGGMITTNNEKIHERLKKLRDYGRRTRYEHTSLGYNSRLDSMQAIFLSEKLKRLNKWNKQRSEAANLYKILLKDCAGIKLPQVDEECGHIWHIFAVRLKNRDMVMNRLLEAGIQTMVHYPVPLHLQEVFTDLGYKKGDYPISENIAKEVLCLPIYPHITKKQIEYVAEKLRSAVEDE